MRLDAFQEKLSGGIRLLYDSRGGPGNHKAMDVSGKNVIDVAFEEFLKQKTSEDDLPGAVRALRNRGVLTPTQAQIIERLYGFRSEVFGATHAGEVRTPTESDALWFLDTVSAQILFLERTSR